MKINNAGLAIIKKAEGLRLDAYRCPTGVLTIGFGHTGADVHTGKVITPGEAERLLMEDVRRFEVGVEACLDGRPATENQFSAMVSLAFNIGLGNFATSSVLKFHKVGKINRAADSFLLWNKANRQVLPGLVTRREAERELYLRA